MKKDNYTYDIYKLKYQINRIPPETLEEIYLIMFNAALMNYPNHQWSTILPAFFHHLPNSKEEIIIFTILAYKLGNQFLSVSTYIQRCIIRSLLKHEIKPYYLTVYAKLFLDWQIYELTLRALNYNLIYPEQIYHFLIINYHTDTKNKKQVIDMLTTLLSKEKSAIFSHNYTFFNIYHSLNKLLKETMYEVDKSIIDLIPLFNTIPEERIKKQIVQDFKHIEENDKSILEKIDDAIIVASNYAYDLPMARQKNLKDK